MDLLYHRYADPFSFLSRMIPRYGLTKAIVNMWNEAQEERVFSMYLHSFSDKSFLEYKKEVLNSANLDNTEVNDEDKVEIVKESNDILNKFTPFKEGGENNGTV